MFQDKTEIDKVVSSFFTAFTNKNNAPNFDLLFQVCLPEVQVILLNPGEYIIYNLTTFIEPRKTILSDGTLTNFAEFEVKEQTTVVGNLAQRFSRYEKSGIRNSIPFKQQGHKLFQLIKLNGSWKISAVIWEDDLS